MQKIIIPIVVGVVALSSGFFGGIKYQASKDARGGNMMANGTFFTGSQGRTGGAGGRGGTGFRANGGGGIVNGEVLNKDATSVTLKLLDGGSKIVFLSNSTSIMTAAKGTINDVEVGTNIMAIGTTNQDGSITAQSLQLRQPTMTPSQQTK